MKNFNESDEIFIVVMKRFSSDCPKLHKGLNDRFYLTPEEAWKVAARENADSGGPFWTVIAFSGQIICEFEDYDDVEEYYCMN